MSEQGITDRRAPAVQVSDVTRSITAAAMACAAIVHFAYAPAHFDHATTHGTFFAVVGWVQLLLAGALAFRAPQQRLWLALTVGINTAVVAVWVVSRTVGVPGEDEAEAVGFPDTLATVLEIVAVLGAAAILANLLADRPVRSRPAFGFGALGALATMLLVSLSIAPSFAGSHTHGDDTAHGAGGDGHGHALDGDGELATADHPHDEEEGDDAHGHDDGTVDDHDDDGAHDHIDDRDGSELLDDDHDDDHEDDGHSHGPTTTRRGRTPTTHGHGSPTTTHGHGSPTTTHGHGPTTTHGQGPTTTHGHGPTTTGTGPTTTHGHEEPPDDWAATRLAALTGHLPAAEIAEFREKAFTNLSAEIRSRSTFLAGVPEPERTDRITAFANWSVDNALEAENGHSHGPRPWVPITNPVEQLNLQVQLAAAGTVIPRYPTAADAVEGGYTQVTPYIPGIAAHYMNFRLADRTFDAAAPEMLLYNGNTPSSELVGVSYAMFGAEPGPLDGFVGPNDEWHEHPSLCTIGTFVVGPDHTPDATCSSVGGGKLRGNSLWMSHLWQVPGWESQWGLFSGENPAVNMATSDLMRP